MKVSSLTMKAHARTMEIHNQTIVAMWINGWFSVANFLKLVQQNTKILLISWKSGKIKRFFLGKVAEMVYFCLRKVETLC